MDDSRTIIEIPSLFVSSRHVNCIERPVGNGEMASEQVPSDVATSCIARRKWSWYLQQTHGLLEAGQWLTLLRE